MRRRKSVCGLDRNLDGLFYPDRLLHDPLTQCVPVDELGRNEVTSFELTDVVNRDDVRMVEAGGRMRFFLEPAQTIRVLREPCRQQLERNLTAEARVFG